MTNQKTNWKYILIVSILAIIVGGGILGYYRWIAKEKIGVPEVKAPKKPIFNLIKTKLAMIPEGYEIISKEYGGTIIFSPDGRKVAYIVAKEGKVTLFLNDKEINTADRIDFLKFSKDSRHLSYVYTLFGEISNSHLVFNDKEIATCENAYEINLSPDARHYACIIEKKAEDYKYGYFVNIDGKEEEVYDSIWNFNFSPNGERYLYLARKNGKDFIVIDGKENQVDGYIRECHFSPDSQHLAYLIEKGKYETVVVFDGKESKIYDYVFHPGLVFSPDSQHLAYRASREGDHFMVLDGEEGEFYLGVGFPSFSPDSKHFGHSAVTGTITSKTRDSISYTNEKHFLIIDGKVSSKIYDGGVGTPIFSPDGNRIGYIAQTKEKVTPYKPKSFIVFDNKEGKFYDKIINGPFFSPDGQHIAYIARDNKRGSFLVVDQNEIKIDHDIIIDSIFFSPDSKHIAYKAVSGNRKFFVAINGKEGETYDEIYGTPIFSPDGKHIAYGARKGDELWWIVDEIK